jgi:hypothetical protein
MESDEIIDRLIRQSQEGLELLPGISSFDRTMRKLEQKKKKQRRIIAAYLFTCLILLTGVGILFYPFSSRDEKRPAARTYVLEPKQLVSGQTSGIVIPPPSSLVTKSLTPPSVSASTPYYTRTLPLSRPEQPNVNGDKKHDVVLPPSRLPLSLSRQMTSAIKESTLLPAGILTEQSEGTPAFSEPVQQLTENMEEQQINVSSQGTKEQTALVNMEIKPFATTTIDSAGILKSEMAVLSVIPVSIPKKEETIKDLQFVAGINFTPQASTLALSRKPATERDMSMFADNYMAQRKQTNDMAFDYSAGIKMGLISGHKWEFLFGAGYQKYGYQERPVSSPGITTSVSSVNPPGYIPNALVVQLVTASAPSPVYQNTFHYFNVSLECNRMIPTRLVMVKIGLSMLENYLVKATSVFVQGPYDYEYAVNYHGSPLNRWIFVPEFNLGVVKDLTNHFQIQFCSKAFYGINSMFDHTYFLSQRCYGIGLEGTLLYKF